MLGWDYPILTVVAVAVGVTFYVALTRGLGRTARPETQRDCPRCKLSTRGEATLQYLFCPYCGAKYLQRAG